ncbi:hypothetical protein FE88_07760 [Azospirillum brasilense]|nr:hypothetical protein APCd_gp54 [Azospirillum phage Cd]OPH16882.1 hypothetical protein FE89_02685 [Azospirillum brasilense]OPH21565.1 hypothetical protein FE88_07760 [Azospirillum brasilense]PWC97708.1 hypothetical protein AEJ54_00880 [Azospirillum sp. Sp 7]CAO99380.1 hypothetical protein [Azospirillum phage Cd]
MAGNGHDIDKATSRELSSWAYSEYFDTKFNPGVPKEDRPWHAENSKELERLSVERKADETAALFAGLVDAVRNADTGDDITRYKSMSIAAAEAILGEIVRSCEAECEEAGDEMAYREAAGFVDEFTKLSAALRALAAKEG